jgi:hypothetical protein
MDAVWRLQRGRRVVEEEEREREQERGVEKENSRDSVFISLSIALKCAELYRLLLSSRRIYRDNWLDRHRYCTPAEWGCYLHGSESSSSHLLVSGSRTFAMQEHETDAPNGSGRGRDGMMRWHKNRKYEVRGNQSSKKKGKKGQESVAYGPII